MNTRYFLYLAKNIYTEAWVQGGVVPLYLASRYLSPDRNGTQTPDENLIYKSSQDVFSIQYTNIDPSSNFRDLTMVGNTVNGKLLPAVESADYYRQDGVVLCLSKRFDKDIAARLGKEACVEIIDIQALKSSLDLQLGIESQMGSCFYTFGHERSHFLKHVSDGWMHEFRLFWHVGNDVKVKIPSGTSVVISLDADH